MTKKGEKELNDEEIPQTEAKKGGKRKFDVIDEKTKKQSTRGRALYSQAEKDAVSYLIAFIYSYLFRLFSFARSAVNDLWVDKTLVRDVMHECVSESQNEQCIVA
jgi:hypothetical protein